MSAWFPWMILLAGCTVEGDSFTEPPPIPEDTSVPPDNDGDGWNEDEDCYDQDPAVYPGAPEVCNGWDDDCDEDVDEDAVDAQTWYVDADEDGYGDANLDPRVTCDPPDGYSLDGTDCDDTTPLVNPGAQEWCDDFDRDCDGLTYEPHSVDALRFFADEDGDGYGDMADFIPACSAPSGAVENSIDCDDTNPDIHPGAEDPCGDGVDGDCSGWDEACPMSGDIPLAGDSARLLGESDGDLAGTAVSCAGDVDGDGDDDVAMGAPGAGSAGQGAVWVFPSPFTSPLDPSWAMGGVVGDTMGDALGASLANAWDVDGDGDPDLLVGAPGSDLLAADGGAVGLMAGPVTGTLTLSDATALVVGATAGDGAGTSVAGLGKYSGDGFDDIIVGAPSDSGAGAAWIFFGTLVGSLGPEDARVVLSGEVEGDQAGLSVAGVGDVSGDGKEDALVGAPGAGGGAGRAYLVLGPTTGTLSLADADAVFEGSPGSALGTSVSGAGDLNSDGYTDLALGAPSWEGLGAALVFLGAIRGTHDAGEADATLMAVVPGDEAGASVAGVGDTNRDWKDDLLVGAPGESTLGAEAGAAYLFMGPVSGSMVLSEADIRYFGEHAGARAGASVAGAGDTERNGYDDLLIGSPGLLSETGLTGGAYLLFGVP